LGKSALAVRRFKSLQWQAHSAAMLKLSAKSSDQALHPLASLLPIHDPFQ
jgi:hypothetical protein